MQLFSRIDIALFAMPIRFSSVEIEKERMTAVIATPRYHPVFRPMYRFVNARKNPRRLPIATARKVSWGTESPR